MSTSSYKWISSKINFQWIIEIAICVNKSEIKKQGFFTFLQRFPKKKELIIISHQNYTEPLVTLTFVFVYINWTSFVNTS